MRKRKLRSEELENKELGAVLQSQNGASCRSRPPLMISKYFSPGLGACQRTHDAMFSMKFLIKTASCEVNGTTGGAEDGESPWCVVEWLIDEPWEAGRAPRILGLRISYSRDIGLGCSGG